VNALGPFSGLVVIKLFLEMQKKKNIYRNCFLKMLGFKRNYKGGEKYQNWWKPRWSFWVRLVYHWRASDQ